MLAQLAFRTVGIPVEETKNLNFEQIKANIRAALDRCAELNIHSIPTFIINGSRILSGAADAYEFSQLFELIHLENETAQPPIFAQLLNIPSDLIFDDEKALLVPQALYEPVDE
mmetsp:Transcript_11449/g.15629  ORF Transcript_11449/g.15629 Transcript_11449/m.15629 type:complete len:114 (-) Transcript_11449:1493-1834(-)